MHNQCTRQGPRGLGTECRGMMDDVISKLELDYYSMSTAGCLCVSGAATPVQ